MYNKNINPLECSKRLESLRKYYAYMIVLKMTITQIDRHLLLNLKEKSKFFKKKKYFKLFVMIK